MKLFQVIYILITLNFILYTLNEECKAHVSCGRARHDEPLKEFAMRRPTFNRWIRTRILSIAHTRSFSLRKLSARAQAEHDDKLLAALMLYAHENDCVQKLLSYVYDEEARRELAAVEQRLGDRSIERLALRGTPMRSLPPVYCDFLIEFEQAYHMPERVDAEKRELLEQAREAMLRTGASPTELARQLGVDRANLNAFLVRGETHRVSLDVARRLAEFNG